MNVKERHIKVCILASMSILFAIACTDIDWLENDRTDLSKNKNEQLTKQDAQQWFESNYAPVVTTRVSEGTESLIKPSWEKAKEHNRKRYEVVEAPILSQNNSLMLDSKTAQIWTPEQKLSFVRNTTKMVVMRDKLTGETSSFIMVFIGSYDYLLRTRSIGRNSYLYREPDFDGSVMFYQIDGTFINGWKYSDGEIVATITLSIEGNQQSTEETSATRALVEECYDYTYTNVTEVCTDYFTMTEYGTTYNDTKCELEFETIFTQHCRWVDDGNNEDKWWEKDNPPGGVYNPWDPNTSIVPDQFTILEYVSRLEKLMNTKFLVPVKLNRIISGYGAYNYSDRCIYITPLWFELSYNNRLSVLYHEFYHSKYDLNVSRNVAGEVVEINTGIKKELTERELQRIHDECMGYARDYPSYTLAYDVCIDLITNLDYVYMPSNYYQNEINAYTAQLNGEQEGWYTLSQEERNEIIERIDIYTDHMNRALDYESKYGYDRNGSKK